MKRHLYFPSLPTRFLILTAAVSPYLAYAEGASSAVSSSAPPDLGSSVLQMLMSLAFVIALMIGGLYLLKKLSAPRGSANNLLRIVAATAVGARERVVVLEVADTWLVLGVTPGQVTALHQLPAQVRTAATQENDKQHDFAGWLRKTMERRNAS